MEINQPFITSDANGPKHLIMTLSRAKLEQIVGDLVDKTMEPVKQALSDAKLEAGKIEEVIMVGGMTRMPLVIKKVEEFFGKKAHLGVNPDEVVAVGAAVEIHVLQGERGMAADNKSLGKFILDGIPPSPRGIPQVEVSFDIDANGILNVSAKDKATGKEQKIAITGSTGLSKEEVEKMKKDAELHAEEDKKKKEIVETRNQADGIAFTAEKTLKELGGKVSEEDKKKVEEAVKETREALKSEDMERIKAESKKLEEVMQQVGAKMYQAAQAASQAEQQAQSGQSGQANEQASQGSEEQNKQDDAGKKDGTSFEAFAKEDENVVEGEYEEVKDEKKSE